MAFVRYYEEENSDSIKNKCICYMHYDAVLLLDDGTMINGIISKVDDENVSMLVGEDMQADDESENMNRQPEGRYNRYKKYRKYGRRNYPINRINRVLPVPYPIYPVYPYYPIYPNPFFLL